jgi:hypothetical protein
VLFSLVLIYSEPRSKIPTCPDPVGTLSERAASHPRPFTLSPKGLFPSLQFTPAVFLLTDHCPLTIEAPHPSWSGDPDRVGTAHYRFKSFSCNTYGSPRKCCEQKTYAPTKPFRCNTYKKQGAPFSSFRSNPGGDPGPVGTFGSKLRSNMHRESLFPPPS